uniref:Uncharacterized protein n=1 Tax=Sphaerodactylus townsendi TaxID=933632 RepID=A0ACB8EUU1_9SAUR
MVSSEAHQYTGIVLLLKHFRWTWVGLLAVDDDYGEAFVQSLLPKFSENGICFAFMGRTPKVSFIPGVTEFIGILGKASSVLIKSQTNVTVIYGDVQSAFGLQLMLAAIDFSTGIPIDKVWITTAQWDLSSNTFYKMPDIQVFHGAFSLAVHTNDVLDFHKFVQHRNVDSFKQDGFVREFWQQAFGCLLPQTPEDEKSEEMCSGEEKLETLPRLIFEMSMTGHSYSIYNAVYAVAHAFHGMYSLRARDKATVHEDGILLENTQPWELHSFLKNISFNNTMGDHVFFRNGELQLGFDIINWVTFPNQSFQRVKVGRMDPQASPGKQFSIDEQKITWHNKFKQTVAVLVLAEKFKKGSHFAVLTVLRAQKGRFLLRKRYVVMNFPDTSTLFGGTLSSQDVAEKFGVEAFLIAGCYLFPCLATVKDPPACVFPFVFDGRRYSSCTKDGTVEEKLWCATTNNYDKDSKWKHCSLEEYGGNSNGKPCFFPFVYKNQTFYTCTDEGKAKGRFWCSTTSNFDLEPRWSFCADIRLDANPKGPCVFPFLYNGTSYSSCTSDGISNKKLWCSLTSNYDADLKWTYCQPSGKRKIETGSSEITTERTAMLKTEKVDRGQVTQAKRKMETGFFRMTTERGATLTTGKDDQSRTTKGRSKLEAWVFKMLAERGLTPNTGRIVQCPGATGLSEIKPEVFESTTERAATADTGKVDQGQTTKGRFGIFQSTIERGALPDTEKGDQDQVTKVMLVQNVSLSPLASELRQRTGPDESVESPSCVFPFTYKGKSYWSCTTDGWSDGTFWCATTSNYDADKKWKVCQVSGPDPGVESPRCIFPFIYKGKSYSSCTSEGMSDGKLWCSTTSTYDVDKKWVYCNITGPDTSEEGPSCVFPFIHNGQNYSSCTGDGRTDGRLWCATSRNYDIDKRWAFCTVTKTGCIFPFVYKEKSYRSCIVVGHGERKPWCSTTPNYDTSSKWRLCNESDALRRSWQDLPLRHPIWGPRREVLVTPPQQP